MAIGNKTPLWVAGLALMLARGVAAQPVLPPPSGPPLCPGCNVVLIGIDDVRADSFRVLGATEDVIPSLNLFAGSAIAFTQAISAAPWSLPSFMSIFTGTFPFNHHVTNKYSDFNAEPMPLSRLSELSPGTRTIGEMLHDEGYRAAGFTGGAALEGHFGFSSGFEVWDDSVTFGGFDRSVPEALDWLAKLKKGEKFLLFVHGYDAHAFHAEHFTPEFAKRFRQMREDQMEGKPLDATDDEKRLVRSSYEHSLGILDKNLSPLLAKLAEPAYAKNTVVVVMADHGEELFDHGGIDHGMTLYDELVHVPLFMRIPGQSPKAVPFQVRTVDVVPTLLEVLGLKPGDKLSRQFRGASLVPTLRGMDLHLEALCETDFLLQVSLRALRGISGWKIVYDRYTPAKTRLYQLTSDPKEKTDVSAKVPDIAGLLKSRILLIFGTQ